VKINIDGEKQPSLDKTLKSKRVLQKWKSFPNGANNSYKGGSRSKKWSKDMYSELLQVQVIIFCLINFQRYCYFLIDGPLTSIWRCVGGDL